MCRGNPEQDRARVHLPELDRAACLSEISKGDGQGSRSDGWVNCDSCAKALNFEFAVDAKLGKTAEKPAATARIAELGWKAVGDKHLRHLAAARRGDEAVGR